MFFVLFQSSPSDMHSIFEEWMLIFPWAAVVVLVAGVAACTGRPTLQVALRPADGCMGPPLTRPPYPYCHRTLAFSVWPPLTCI